MTTPRPTLRAGIGQALLLIALAVLAGWLPLIQPQDWPMPTPLAAPRWLAGIALLLYLGFCAWTFHPRHGPATMATAATADAWLVVYASQTGCAQDLADRTAAAVRQAGHEALLVDIAHLDPARLAGRHCLWIASTTGEGDPPDHALAFAGATMAAAIDLRDTRYAVLALGDRGYARFCAFGHALNDWLRHAGAQPLFDLVEVDNADPGALRHWQHQVGVASGGGDQPDWSAPRYTPWTLARRIHLNPGSAGGEAFHIALEAPAGRAADWQAGDIAEIGPRNADTAVRALLAATGLDGATPVTWQGQNLSLAHALGRARLPPPDAVHGRSAGALAAQLQPLPHREYSIASIPADGQLQLLVRLMQREDGSLGHGSGWLCRHANVGDVIDLRIRSNPGFHAPAPERPMILIGNGTGLAGLRAHLKARQAAGAHRNWLLFGERNAAHDSLHDAELQGWLQAGVLTRLDRVFSRDREPHRYVQHRLLAEHERLRAWVEDGASIHVCGSVAGMAPGVHAALVEALGEAGVESLLQSGRYRRDVY